MKKATLVVQNIQMIAAAAISNLHNIIDIAIPLTNTLNG